MKNGFRLVVGKKLYFYETGARNKTKSVVQRFISEVCENRGITGRNKDLYMNDVGCIKDFQYKMEKGTLRHVPATGTIKEYYVVETAYSYGSYDIDEVVIFK